MALSLEEVQQQAVEFGVAHGRFGLALPIGGRKTSTSLQWAKAAGAGRILIVAPAQVYRHWQNEAAKRWPELSVFPGRGTPTFRGQQRTNVFKAATPAALVVGYETMRDDIELIKDLKWDAVIADEAHRLKNRSALVHKKFKLLASRIPLMDLASGNMITARAEELWTILHMIDPRKYRSFWRWAHEHFEVETNEYGWNPRPVQIIVGVKPGHMELLRAEAAQYIYEADIDVVGSDPIQTILPVELNADERRIYDQLVRKGWAQLNGDVLQTSNKLATSTRLRQLASDWGNLAEGFGPGSKAKATLELIEDIGRPTVVFSAFRETAELIAGQASGVPYHGKMTPKLRERSLELFATGTVPVFSATTRAASEGLDGLQYVSHDIILLDRDWAPTVEDQAIGRLNRSGQQHRVNVWHIVASNTEDERIAQAHVDKREVIEALRVAS